MKKTYALAIAMLGATGAMAQNVLTNNYLQTNLVSDGFVKATHTDANLKNPWGLSRASTTPWWVSDEATGKSTLYRANGAVSNTVVSIQQANGTLGGTPTGTAFFAGTFVFVTIDGTIQAWDGTSPSGGTFIKVNNSASGASYQGCTVGKIGTQFNLYVTNQNGGVEVYNESYQPVKVTGPFTDPSVPAGETPSGIQSIGADIYVTYSNPNDGVVPGNGWVSVYDSEGNFKMHLAGGNYFNDPWGIAKAPAKGFGKFSKRILVGMQASGQIAAFNATTGAFIDVLRDRAHHPIANPGLWAIYFGGGNTANGPKTTLYFASGLNNNADGVFGTLVAK